MNDPNNTFDRELRTGARYLAQALVPERLTIPRMPGIDVYGMTVPLNGIAGGDLITYVNFHDQFDLDARIHSATLQQQVGVSQALQRLRNVSGILVADVSGHEFADAMTAFKLYQVFHTAVLYEMELSGEITVRLFDHLNTRFLNPMTSKDHAADRNPSSFITLIYGEISSGGRFHFVIAGHPPPLVFSSKYNRFVVISEDRLLAYPPIGLQPSEDQEDIRHYSQILGYKRRYSVNEINLMAPGDILLLYTDGLLDIFSDFTLKHLEYIVSDEKHKSARDICEVIIAKRAEIAAQTDDISVVLIKRN